MWQRCDCLKGASDARDYQKEQKPFSPYRCILALGLSLWTPLALCCVGSQLKWIDEPRAFFLLPLLPDQFPSLTTLLHLPTALLSSLPMPPSQLMASTTYFLLRLPCCRQPQAYQAISISLRVVCSACGHAEPARSGRTRCISTTWQGDCLEGHTHPKSQVAPLCPWADSNACSRYFRFRARWHWGCHFPLCTCGDLSWRQWELQVHIKTATNFMLAENFERVKLSCYRSTCLLPWMIELFEGWHQHISCIVAAVSTSQGIHTPLAFLISCTANNSTAFCY